MSCCRVFTVNKSSLSHHEAIYGLQMFENWRTCYRIREQTRQQRSLRYAEYTNKSRFTLVTVPMGTMQCSVKITRSGSIKDLNN